LSGWVLMMFFLAPVNLKVVALQGHFILLTEILKIQCRWGFTCLSGYKRSMPLLWVQLSMFWISSSHLGGVLGVFKKCWKYAFIALNKHRLSKIQLFDNTVVLGSGQFNTHYIIFRNVEMFNFFLETFFLKENKNLMEYLWIYHLLKWNPQN